MNNRNRPRPTSDGSRKPNAGGRDARFKQDAGAKPPRGAGPSHRSERPRHSEPSRRPEPPAPSPVLEREEDEASADQYLAGKHPVLEALRAGRALNKIWLSNQAQRSLVQPILEEAKERGVVVQFADKKKLDQLAPDMQHQGVVAQAAAVSYADVDDLLARARELGEAPLLVLLDEVEDPHNLGSILRTADCTGVHGVIVPKRRSASLTAVVAKTSAGAVEYVPVARVANLAQTIDKLKEEGVWIAGADVAADHDVYKANLTGPLAIIIGSEGKGISRLVKEKCDFLIKLPMFGKINSLNASVAAGVILYESVRQRQAARSGQGEGHASP